MYIDRDGVIVAVSAASDPPPPGFATGAVNRVDAGADAVIYPGLIDLHNHIAYRAVLHGGRLSGLRSYWSR